MPLPLPLTLAETNQIHQKQIEQDVEQGVDALMQLAMASSQVDPDSGTKPVAEGAADMEARGCCHSTVAGCVYKTLTLAPSQQRGVLTWRCSAATQLPGES